MHVRFREERQGNSPTTPCLLLYSVPGRAGCIWQLSLIPSPGMWWVGQGNLRCHANSRWMHHDGNVATKTVRRGYRVFGQGSQYGSDDWQRFCRANNLALSMSRRGNCWENAVVESFFSSLKKERIRKRIYKTRDLARADIFDYIEVFYNRSRRHSHLGGVSPEAFEQASS